MLATSVSIRPAPFNSGQITTQGAVSSGKIAPTRTFQTLYLAPDSARNRYNHAIVLPYPTEKSPS